MKYYQPKGSYKRRAMAQQGNGNLEGEGSSKRVGLLADGALVNVYIDDDGTKVERSAVL